MKLMEWEAVQERVPRKGWAGFRWPFFSTTEFKVLDPVPEQIAFARGQDLRYIHDKFKRNGIAVNFIRFVEK